MKRNQFLSNDGECMMCLEILGPCFLVALLVGGLYLWIRSVAYLRKKQDRVRKSEGSFFKGGRW